MGKRRKSSGFFETVYKSVTGTGTTVHRKKGWLGRNVTVVKHHDTGKTKKYTHGAGLFGTTTKTETRDGHGKVTERGKVKQTVLGSTVEVSQKQDGSGQTTKRVLNESLLGRIFRFFTGEGTTTTHDASGSQVGTGTTGTTWLGGTTTEYTGQCFGCEGKGSKTLICNNCAGSGTFVGACRVCAGSGQFQAHPMPCRDCQASGKHGTVACRRCSGTGQWVPPSGTCRKCSGSGKFSASCRKCSGRGNATLLCKRCSGTGVFRKGA